MTATVEPVAQSTDPAPREVPTFTWVPRMVLSIEELKELQSLKGRLVHEVMRDGEHYGTIPGTTKQGEEPKKVLLKPGAELLFAAFGLHPEMVDDVPPIQDATGLDGHGGEPYYEHRRACLVWKQTGPGPDDRMLVARAAGLCHSWEKKYRTRKGGRVCPNCGKATIRVSNYDDRQGRREWGKGSYWCSNKGDCNAKFAKGDQAIEGQQAEDMPNPDVADLKNTLLKIADKRGFVAGALLSTGTSDMFTQDIEDNEDDGTGSRPAADADGVIPGRTYPHDGPVDEGDHSEPAAPASGNGGVPTSSTDVGLEVKRTILLQLSADTAPAAGFKAVRVNAMLAGPFTPEKVLDQLCDAHRKHCPPIEGKDCIHITAARATWPAA